MPETLCPFCIVDEGNCTLTSEHLLAFADKFPVTKGHHLIIPRQHRLDYFELNEAETHELNSVLKKLKKHLQAEDSTITGFNIGMNCGQAAGQTIFHCHVHLIPRRPQDTSDPTGGVRGVIPGKQCY